MKKPKTVANKTWAQLQVGDKASIERTCLERDLFLFAHVSGNTNPLMLPRAAGEESGAGEESAEAPVAPSMWVGSLISAVLGNLLPGPGTLYRRAEFGIPASRPCRRPPQGDGDLPRKARRAGRGLRHIDRQRPGPGRLQGACGGRGAHAHYRNPGARIAGADHGGKGAVSASDRFGRAIAAPEDGGGLSRRTTIRSAARCWPMKKV